MGVLPPKPPLKDAIHPYPDGEVVIRIITAKGVEMPSPASIWLAGEEFVSRLADRHLVKTGDLDWSTIRSIRSFPTNSLKGSFR